MKQFTLIAAAGSLAVFAAPAQATEIAPMQDSASIIATEMSVPSSISEDPWAFSEDPPRHARAYGRRYRDRYDDDDYYDDDDRYERRRYSKYDRYGRYREPRRIHRGDRIWRGRDGRYYCKRDNGTTGLIIGAAGGALIGRTIDTRGDRTVGTLLGGALGAVIGREIDRGSARCR